jgi:hypothetical protein
VTFDLEHIQAVIFRCGECRTVLTFPRLRWANFPDNCPNCGARWMNRPRPDNLLNEDPATSAFRAIRSFREALQALIGLGKTVGFAIGLEIDKTIRDSNSEPAESGLTEKIHQ